MNFYQARTNEKNMIVVKDNALINASYNLELTEQRLLLLAIIEARKSGTGINANDPLVIHADSYINQFKVHRNTAYQSLKDACENLFMRQFSYQAISEKGNIQNHKSRWVSKIAYTDNEAVVQLIFAPDVVPLITRLEQHFTSYELQQVALLKSKYAIRLYELLVAWKKAGKTPIFQLEDFRNSLGLTANEYPAMCNFKLYVLDLAVKQINTHSDIHVTYDQHKEGRKIIGFSFKFKQKTQPKKIELAEKDSNTIDLFTGLTEKQIPLFANKLAHDSTFAQQHAEPGEEYIDLERRLLKKLCDPDFVLTYKKDLQRVGLKI